jgi:DNA-directed RNA polymerase subunit RPC12/RpoP
MTVRYTYRCAACSHHGQVHLDDDSHEGEHTACSACGATATLEWVGGATLHRAAPTVETLMAAAFMPGRDPRSAEYKEGVRAVLTMRIDGRQMVVPYTLGTAQCGAYLAGCEEGKAIWRERTAISSGSLARRDNYTDA